MRGFIQIRICQIILIIWLESSSIWRPFQIEKDTKGYLIVDLSGEEPLSKSDQEFLNTFASSLAVMLQNKFFFEEIRNKHAVLRAVLESMSEGLMLVNNEKEIDYVNEFFLNIVANGIEDDLW